MAEIAWCPPQSELPWELTAVMVEQGTEMTRERWIGHLGSRVQALVNKLPRAERKKAMDAAARELQADLAYQDPAFAAENLVEMNERLQEMMNLAMDVEWPVTAEPHPDRETAAEMMAFLAQDELEFWVERAAAHLFD